MQRAGSILRQFIKDYGVESGLTLQRIRNQWKSLVGEAIALHTSPAMLKGKTIFITVDTPQWMHHLSFYKQEITEKLKLYKLEDVRFRIGKIEENLNNEPRITENLSTRCFTQLTDEDVRYIENTVETLKDTELKEKFRHLLSNALRHKKK